MIFLILILLIQTTTPSVYAANNETYYARVLFDQVYLYKSPYENNDISNIYFEIPKTYFVELVSKTGDFYQAKYRHFTGYIKKDGVQAIIGTPKTPFLNNVTFRVYAELSTNLMSAPSIQTSSTIITNIPLLTKNISYLGKINGECLIDGRTDIWYFCKYTAEKDYYGYVYSDFCDEMPSSLPINTEEVEYTNNPTFSTTIEPVKSIPITSNYVGIIIAILSIPALIFIFMVMKGTRIFGKEKQRSKEIIDY